MSPTLAGKFFTTSITWVELREFKAKGRVQRPQVETYTCVSGSSKDPVTNECKVYSQAGTRQELKTDECTGASLKANFCAELRSLTWFCKQWEAVRFKWICNVNTFLL